MDELTSGFDACGEQLTEEAGHLRAPEGACHPHPQSIGPIDFFLEQGSLIKGRTGKTALSLTELQLLNGTTPRNPVARHDQFCKDETPARPLKRRIEPNGMET